MEISHRVTFNKNSEVLPELDALGIKYKINTLPGDHYTIHFDINESDINWPGIQNLIKSNSGMGIPLTTYSDDEILKSEFCLAIPSFETDYPYPKATWIKEKPIFYKDYCEKCGVYSSQAKSYRLLNEPHLNKHHFMTLIWGNLSIFAVPNVFELFSNHNITGYDKTPVYLKDTQAESSSVSQIQIANYTKPGLITNTEVKSYKCPLCSTLKYEYPKRGSISYSPESLHELDFQLTNEWFGDGLVAYHLPIVSKRVVKLIIDEKLTGLQLKPIIDKN